MKTLGIIEWLETCPYIEGVAEFDVNQLDDEQAAGIFKQPAITREELIDGSEIITENYYMLFRRSAQIKAERLSNDDLIEAVETWVAEQAMKGIYPDIGYRVFEIDYSNAGYMIERDDKDAIYQLTIEVKYERNLK